MMLAQQAADESTPIDGVKRQESSSSLASESSAGSSSSSINSGDEDPADTAYIVDKPSLEIEEELFHAIQETDAAAVRRVLGAYPPSQLLQSLLTYSYTNRPPHVPLDISGSKPSGLSSIAAGPMPRDRSPSLTIDHTPVNNVPATTTTSTTSKRLSAVPGSGLKSHTSASQLSARPFFTHDPEVMQEAQELLGTSVSPLSFIMMACMLGEEEIAQDIVHFVYKQTAAKRQKLLLMEFLGKVWGDGNTTLHLASFQGMSELVKTLIQYGANTNRRNGRGYRAVDCADDDLTRGLFRSINEVERLSFENGKKTAHKYNSLPRKLTPAKAELMSALHENSIPEIGSHGTARVSAPDPITISPSKSLSSLNSAMCGTPVSIRTSGAQTPRVTGKRSVSIVWDPNTLLLDCAKNGELEKMRELLEAHPHTEVIKPADTNNKEEEFSPRTQQQIYRPDIRQLNINYQSGHTEFTPLHLACAYGHLDVVKYLIEDRHADVTLVDAEGWTPLHSLIAEIPDPVSTNAPSSPNQNTAKEVQERERFLGVLKYLLAVPAVNLKSETRDGETIIDVVKENDDTGELDVEVLHIVQDALADRGIELRSGSTSDDEVSGEIVAREETEKKPTNSNDNLGPTITGITTTTPAPVDMTASEQNQRPIIDQQLSPIDLEMRPQQQQQLMHQTSGVTSTSSSPILPIGLLLLPENSLTTNSNTSLSGLTAEEKIKVLDIIATENNNNNNNKVTLPSSKRDTAIAEEPPLPIQTLGNAQRAVSNSSLALEPQTVTAELVPPSMHKGRISAPPGSTTTARPNYTTTSGSGGLASRVSSPPRPLSGTFSASFIGKQQQSSNSSSQPAPKPPTIPPQQSPATAVDTAKKPAFSTASLSRQSSTSSGTYTKKATMPREPTTSIFAAPKSLFHPPTTLGAGVNGGGVGKTPLKPEPPTPSRAK